jgi:hypothetical protein
MVVSLLLVLTLAFTIFVRFELRGVVNHQQRLQARANARLGANLAIARLQETLGPDQRVSARADLFDGSVANLSGMPTPAAGHPKWIGVWNSEGVEDADPGDKPFVDWLISRGAGRMIPLLDEGSVGNPDDRIVAGLVLQTNGGHAWVVEDEGVKAQLRADFRNDHPVTPLLPGGGLIPGVAPPEAHPGLESLSGATPEDLDRLNGPGDLTFLSSDSEDPSPAHRFDYTLRSLGVLSNTRDGGLRKDLTIAFENDAVFDRVFPDRALPVNPDASGYFVLDPDKLAASADLRDNGYIHMGIFRDYYNLKRHIELRGGVPVLHQAGIDWFDINQNENNPPDSPLGRGTLGPHQMGPSLNDSEHQAQRPFGEIDPEDQTPETRPYLHNPVGTAYAYLQVNGWLEVLPAEFDAGGTETAPQRYTTHAQLLAGFYNPYNIGLRIKGRDDSGPKLMNWPQLFLDFPGVTTDPSPGAKGFGGSILRIGTDQEPEVIPPGRARVYSIEDYADRDTGQAYYGGAQFGNAIAHLVSESFVSPETAWPGDPNQPVSASMTVTYNRRPVMSMGNGDPRWSAHPHDSELNQVFYEPFHWETHNQSGAYRVEETLTPSESVNAPFTFAMRLRTTRESPADAIRPLIDSNIRARWNNPRWDSPLGLDHLAVFSPDMTPSDTLPQMDIGEAPLGHLYAGAGRDPLDGTDRVILFDIPREDLLSLGQLQHAAAGRFSYEPSYIAGNSYANPRIPLNQWRASVSDTYSSGLEHRISGNFNLYDASYLVNQRLWDGYVFTTLPQVADNFTPGEPAIDYPRIHSLEQFLPNPRFLPYKPEGSSFTQDVLSDEGTDAHSGSFHHNAGHLLVDGSFNINSTSVNAWEAFLSSTLGLPVQQIDENGNTVGFRAPGNGRVRFPRTQSPLGEGMLREAPDDNYWTGFRELTPTEVRELAEAVVVEVKRRGPFLNRAEFINRMLRNGPEGQAGALQAALDTTVNRGISSNFERNAGAVDGNSTQGAGFPGQLLQGDILQALSPMMSARSDTFTVRAYGEIGPAGNPLARAWCEVEVQRVPDPVLNGAFPADDEYLRELANPSSPFGRHFKIISFRWLSRDEI